MAASHAQASSSRPPSAAGTAASSTAASGSNGPAYHGLAHLDAYTEGELIGQGSFGVIHKVTRKSDGRVRRPFPFFFSWLRWQNRVGAVLPAAPALFGGLNDSGQDGGADAFCLSPHPPNPLASLPPPPVRPRAFVRLA